MKDAPFPTDGGSKKSLSLKTIIRLLSVKKQINWRFLLSSK